MEDKMVEKWWKRVVLVVVTKYKRQHSNTLKSPKIFVSRKFNTLADIRIQVTDISSLKSEFLTYLGVQKHVQCSINHITLIDSTDKTLKYNCGKSEFNCRCIFDCKFC